MPQPNRSPQVGFAVGSLVGESVGAMLVGSNVNGVPVGSIVVGLYVGSMVVGKPVVGDADGDCDGDCDNLTVRCDFDKHTPLRL